MKKLFSHLAVVLCYGTACSQQPTPLYPVNLVKLDMGNIRGGGIRVIVRNDVIFLETIDRGARVRRLAAFDWQGHNTDVEILEITGSRYWINGSGKVQDMPAGAVARCQGGEHELTLARNGALSVSRSGGQSQLVISGLQTSGTKLVCSPSKGWGLAYHDDEYLFLIDPSGAARRLKTDLPEIQKVAAMQARDRNREQQRQRDPFGRRREAHFGVVIFESAAVTDDGVAFVLLTGGTMQRHVVLKYLPTGEHQVLHLRNPGPGPMSIGVTRQNLVMADSMNGTAACYPLP